MNLYCLFMYSNLNKILFTLNNIYNLCSNLYSMVRIFRINNTQIILLKFAKGCFHINPINKNF